MPEASYGSLPFSEQIAFFRRKLNLPTESWTDVYAAEHDWAFVVAGANRNDLVADFRAAVEKVIADGATLESFRKDFDAIVAKHGWDYNGGRNWRSRVIYETNLFSSYSAGRFQQLMEMREERPYWMYTHSEAVEHPREEHLSWNGLILRWDDPWWQTHFPINAWGCQCSVRALSESDLKRMGRNGPDKAPAVEWEDRLIGQRSAEGPRLVRVPKGIDPGFEYTPGRSRLHSQIPPQREGGVGSAGAPGVPNQKAGDRMPAPRPYPAGRLLPRGLSEEEYLTDFLGQFGATADAPAVFADVTGERLVIGQDLFRDKRDALKVLKRGREVFLPLLAETLKAPDEIWARLEWIHSLGKAVVRRRYIARFQIDGEVQPGLAVFETGSDGWVGVTTFAPEEESYLEDLRVGARMYRRGE